MLMQMFVYVAQTSRMHPISRSEMKVRMLAGYLLWRVTPQQDL